MSPQSKNLDWFPRMQAMSLVVTDGDGEQNEMRNLQDRLTSTMNVVSQLTGQLTELKEQVKAKQSLPVHTQYLFLVPQITQHITCTV
jgi:hypothetical protein